MCVFLWDSGDSGSQELSVFPPHLSRSPQKHAPVGLWGVVEGSGTRAEPCWRSSKRLWRSFFLEELGKALVTPHEQKQQLLPHTAALTALVRTVQRSEPGPDQRVTQEENRTGQKRRRCDFCPPKKDFRTGTTCCRSASPTHSRFPAAALNTH